ncbi:putative endo-1,3(4)-beta-glucanase [Hortaea werneckii]|nr:putative endo-1,3(4)-beta-glucanase [Hortaea werneckii]
MWTAQLLLLFATLHIICNAQDYFLQSNFAGPSFFDNFDFWNKADPTFGYVHYLSRGDAEAFQLINYSNPNTARWGVDTVKYLDPDANLGRPSIRLSSRQTWLHGLFILDLKHMPANVCGVWPAFWTMGTGIWPQTGEIDIIEYQNTLPNNVMALHTTSTPNCSIAGSGQTGTLLTSDCGLGDGYTGCGSSVNKANNIGTGFNTAGGGVYALEWLSTGMKIWFFSRNDIPETILAANGIYGPDPSTFGVPDGSFQGSCDFDSHFPAQQLVFNTDFCGSFAGNIWQQNGCPMLDPQNQWRSCNMYVANNPQAYSEAYWEVNYLKVYQTRPGAAPATSSSLSSVTPLASTSSILSISGNAQGRSTTPTMPFPIVPYPGEVSSTVPPSPSPPLPTDPADDTPAVVIVTQTVTVPGAGGEQMALVETVTSIDADAPSNVAEDHTTTHSVWDANAAHHYPKAPLPFPADAQNSHSPRVHLMPRLPEATGHSEKRKADPQILSGGDFNWCGTPGSSCGHRKLSEAAYDDEAGGAPIVNEKSVHQESSVTGWHQKEEAPTDTITSLPPILPSLGSGLFLGPESPESQSISDLETFPTIIPDPATTVLVVVTETYTTPLYSHQMFTYRPVSLTRRDLAQIDTTLESTYLHEPAGTGYPVPKYTLTPFSLDLTASALENHGLSIQNEINVAPFSGERERVRVLTVTDEPFGADHPLSATISTITYAPHTCTPVVLVQDDNAPTPIGCGGLQTDKIPKLQHISVASTTHTVTTMLPTAIIRAADGPDIVFSELLEHKPDSEIDSQATATKVTATAYIALGIVLALVML